MVASLIPAAISAGSQLLSSGAQKDGAAAANAANQAAIAEAKKIAQEGYDKNQLTIGQTGQKAGQYLDDAFGQTTDQYAPIIASGDRARTYYEDGSGINGADARQRYYDNISARPEYAAAREQAMRGTQQMYGNKLGSGAFARSLQRRDAEFAESRINTDLNRVKPLMDAGNNARGAQANAATNYGNNRAGNEWKMGNAFVSNQNKLTDANVNLAGASGSSNAANATAQGNADAQLFSGLGSAFGSAFGGGKGGGGLSAFGNDTWIGGSRIS